MEETKGLEEKIEKVERIIPLIGKDEIQSKVFELGKQITVDFHGKKPVLICNLKGAFIFLADLCRCIKLPLSIDFIATASYNGVESIGDVRIVKDLKMDVKGRDVILVEDIIDTGYTVDYIVRYLALHYPKSVSVCTLLDKPSRRRVEVKIDYTGFIVDDIFLVGYGLDYNEKYRELEYIGELKIEEKIIEERK